jgi:GR25 family glycosyltransferase involved in LPS biosynthesis
MDWINFIDRIVLLNLAHRVDRLLASAEVLEKYDIPYERIEAIHNKEHGATGLRDTIVQLFEEEIAKKTQHLLVFEDDVIFVEGPDTFHQAMNGVVKQLPEQYHICYLGCQVTLTPTHFYSTNLIPVQKAYATHAWIISYQGMKEILASDLKPPIDNYIVDMVQPLGHCYCTYPLLASQREGLSDIGHAFIDWDPFIVDRYQQQINAMRAR